MGAAQESTIKKNVKLFTAATTMTGDGGPVNQHVKKGELWCEKEHGPFPENEGGYDKRQGEC